MYFDRKCRPITIQRWAELFSNKDYSRVALTEVVYQGKNANISTVWIGCSYIEGKPLIYETMIFFEDENFKIDWGGDSQYRWSTLSEALIGHQEICSSIQQKLSIPFEDMGNFTSLTNLPDPPEDNLC